MKILDRFVSSTGVEVELEEWLTPFGRSYFDVKTTNPNDMFGNLERFIRYDSAFDTFFHIVEHLR